MTISRQARAAFLISALAILTGCTTADKDYIRDHVAVLKAPRAAADNSGANPLPAPGPFGE